VTDCASISMQSPLDRVLRPHAPGGCCVTLWNSQMISR